MKRAINYSLLNIDFQKALDKACFELLAYNESQLKDWVFNSVVKTTQKDIDHTLEFYESIEEYEFCARLKKVWENGE